MLLWGNGILSESRNSGTTPTKLNLRKSGGYSNNGQQSPKVWKKKEGIRDSREGISIEESGFRDHLLEALLSSSNGSSGSSESPVNSPSSELKIAPPPFSRMKSNSHRNSLTHKMSQGEIRRRGNTISEGQNEHEMQQLENIFAAASKSLTPKGSSRQQHNNNNNNNTNYSSSPSSSALRRSVDKVQWVKKSDLANSTSLSPPPTTNTNTMSNSTTTTNTSTVNMSSTFNNNNTTTYSYPSQPTNLFGGINYTYGNSGYFNYYNNGGLVGSLGGIYYPPNNTNTGYYYYNPSAYYYNTNTYSTVPNSYSYYNNNNNNAANSGYMYNILPPTSMYNNNSASTSTTSLPISNNNTYSSTNPLASSNASSPETSPIVTSKSEPKKYNDIADPSFIVCSGSGLGGGIAGEVCTFIIESRDAFNTKCTHGGDKYSCFIHGPSYVEATIKDLNNGYYNVTYNCKSKGLYQISIRLNGVLISSCPYTVLISASSTYSNQCLITSSLRFTAGETALFYIQSRDKYENNRTEGGDKYEVILNGPEVIKCDVSDEGTGTYIARGTPRIAGLYEIKATLEGIEIVGSSSRCIVEFGNTDPLQCTATGSGLSGGLPNVKASFFIQSKDRFGNNRNIGGDLFRVYLRNISNTLEHPIPGKISDNNNGSYSVYYIVEKNGVYELYITLNKLNISGSPFRVTIGTTGYQFIPTSNTPPPPSIISPTPTPIPTTTPTTTIPAPVYVHTIAPPPIVNNSKGSTRIVTPNIITPTPTPTPIINQQIPIKKKEPAIIYRPKLSDKDRKIVKVQSLVRRYLAKKLYKNILKMYRTKIQLVNELLSTEYSYLNILRTIIEVYLIPLRKSTKLLLKPAEISLIFSNLEFIISVNSEYYSKIKSRISTWTPNSCLGDIILSILPAFQSVYSQYINNYDQSIKTVLWCQHKDANFDQFLRVSKDNPRCEKLDLGGLLIQPVQRLPRYELLIKGLVEHTPTSHKDYPKLVEAHTKIREVNDFINSNKRKADNLMKIQLIQNSILDFDKNLCSTHRSFVAELGNIVFLNPNNYHKHKHRHLFLFNDVLLITRKKTFKSAFKFKSVVVLDSVKVAPLPSNADYSDGGFSFSVVNGPATKVSNDIPPYYVCICDSKDSKAFWFTILSNTIKNFVENKQNYPKLVVSTFRV